MPIKDISLAEYEYDLPAEKIAQFPVEERDMSKLLISRGDILSQDKFINITDYLPSDHLLVFNNTRVIRARLLFQKITGATIEIFCIEPLSPPEYQSSFSAEKHVEWKCIIGNLKKWKEKEISTFFICRGNRYRLTAEKSGSDGDAWRIKFRWEGDGITFGEVIEATGHIPLPPYINRKAVPQDSIRYQTIYSTVRGSVAAPTAGLHFTERVFMKIKERGIESEYITLHVNAGTFNPVKTNNIKDHEMHCEHFMVSAATIRSLIEKRDRIIAVGTTSVRTLESLYWLGVKMASTSPNNSVLLNLEQWDPYYLPGNIPVRKALETLFCFITEQKYQYINASTKFMIVPGYNFKMISGIITNFHQPRSTLLLLVSAWTGNKWEKIYRYALQNDYRFLSYGDSSILL